MAVRWPGIAVYDPVVLLDCALTLHALAAHTQHAIHQLTASAGQAAGPTAADWITAISTAALAVFAIVTAVYAIKAFGTQSRQLQLELARRPGRLQKVMPLLPDRHERLGRGFKVLNGPDEVTVSRAILYLTYRMYRAPTLRWVDKVVEFAVLPHDFKILGLSGRALGFRLDPYGEEAWRFSYDLPELSYETVDGQRNQQIELRLTVTASENTETSEPLMLGDESGPMTLLRARTRSRDHLALAKDLISVLAQDAISAIRAINPSAQVPPELEELVLDWLDLPAGLRDWLVDAWQQGGSFSDESTEKLARTLLDIKQQAATSQALRDLLESQHPGSSTGPNRGRSSADDRPTPSAEAELSAYLSPI
jgi:hypothetical protein